MGPIRFNYILMVFHLTLTQSLSTKHLTMGLMTAFILENLNQQQKDYLMVILMSLELLTIPPFGHPTSVSIALALAPH